MAELSSQQAEIALFEANIAAFFLTISRANGSQEYQDEHIHWILGDAPKSSHNVVVRATIPPDLVDEKIREVMRVSREFGQPCMWKVLSSSRPIDLRERLQRFGFENIANPTGMVMDLSKLEPLTLGEGVTVEQVATEGQLDEWMDVMRDGYGLTDAMVEWQKRVLMRVGLKQDGIIRHLLARFMGRPAGISTVFLDGDMSGIYYVATAHDVRKKGIGTAVTWAALEVAQREGCRAAVLEASTMGYSVYLRLGFREICQVGRYQYDGNV